MKLEIYRDEAGDPRARSERSLLGSFLESDLQGNPEHGREILRAIDEVAAGGAEAWEETGNAHTLILSPDIAVIEAEFEDAPPCLLSLDELRDAVSAWVAFLEAERA
ncbi:MAG TPA: hypothetical protein VMW27_01095 [Thermoanaerobaculia bacterium]|nr:hypothetical protein [Thermoanaerobaculia bacterium]